MNPPRWWFRPSAAAVRNNGSYVKKNGVRPSGRFCGIGQLSAHEKLMGREFGKALVVSTGASAALRKVLPELRIQLLEYENRGQQVLFNRDALTAASGG